MHRPQQNMNGIVLLLPHLRLRHVHPLLHVPAGLQSRGPIIRDLGQQRLEIPTLRCAAAFRHQFHQLGMRLVAHAQQSNHLQTIETRLGETEIRPDADQGREECEETFQHGGVVFAFQVRVLGGVEGG